LREHIRLFNAIDEPNQKPRYKVLRAAQLTLLVCTEARLAGYGKLR
jgi:hypothetical protein